MSEPQRIPAEVWPLAYYIYEEMYERGWTDADVVARMGDEKSWGINALTFHLLMLVHKDKLLVGDYMFAKLASIFGVSEEYFRNLDKVWRANPERRAEWECPDDIFTMEFASPPPTKSTP